MADEKAWDSRRALWCRCVGRGGLIADVADEFVDEFLEKYPSWEWHDGNYCPICDGDYLVQTPDGFEIWSFSAQRFWTKRDGTSALMPPATWAPIMAPGYLVEG